MAEAAAPQDAVTAAAALQAAVAEAAAPRDAVTAAAALQAAVAEAAAPHDAAAEALAAAPHDAAAEALAAAPQDAVTAGAALQAAVAEAAAPHDAVTAAAALQAAVEEAAAPHDAATAVSALHAAVAEVGAVVPAAAGLAVGLAAVAASSPFRDRSAAPGPPRASRLAARRALIQSPQPTRSSRPESALLCSTSVPISVVAADDTLACESGAIGKFRLKVVARNEMRLSPCQERNDLRILAVSLANGRIDSTTDRQPVIVDTALGHPTKSPA